MTALVMSGNPLQTILLLLLQMIVILTIRHIPLPLLEVPELASQTIWKAFQTTRLTLVHSRPNRLQL